MGEKIGHTLREEPRLKMSENRKFRRIYGCKRNEKRREWRKLHNEELNDPHSSSNIVQVIKSRIMGWTGHVARMGERRGICRVLVGTCERTNWKTKGVDGRIILRWIFRKWDVGVLTGSNWLRIGRGGGYL
jgi:hypothetical protein